jgi:predicted nucleic acid-binding Zn ribbon protein
MTRMTSTDCQHIGAVLKAVLEQTGAATGGITAVWDIWEETVGAAIAGHTRPAAFKDKLLVVHVAAPAWIQELRYHKADIIDRLNRRLGDTVVGDIRFRTGALR